MNATLRIAVLAAATAALAACGGQSVKPTPPPAAIAKPVSTASSASVVLASASGSLVSGKLNVRPMGDGVHITGEIGGLTPNSTHAIHIHEKGDCSAADATSAGGHFNPAAQPHGQVDRGAHHAGDMDNLVANAEGVAKVDAHASGVTLGGGAPNDVAGRAVIVHASADDYKTQPTGNAGARLACGVIKTGR
ncbi:superoxide dismutase family protein [Lysobacter yananisis]|uniref:Superoxide dismutase [Cu-Zn] n=1 Tax=Lysobacter yananisis TaxID=1003114 RepID=A0ABY9PCX3_9GAMM|nr:superoxide dismutase family protein [Lysobacter yananisis]WMT04804.1 superoxide dismutase family protein [Lysobacter yananisis]